MQRVLLPIDGSECSLHGVSSVISKRAFYLEPDGLDIHLVNVQAPFSNDISSFVSHEQIADFHREKSEEALKEARSLLDSAGAKYTCHSMVGHVPETIAELAESLGCDQIVMGTHGHSALTGLLIGSITKKVLYLTKLPVLLVK